MTDKQAQRKIATLDAIEAAEGNFAEAARILGVGYACAYSRAKNYGVKTRKRWQRCSLTPLRDPGEIAELLEECGGNVAMMGRRLGVSRQRAHQIARRELLGKVY